MTVGLFQKMIADRKPLEGACCHSPGSEIGDNAVVAAGAAVSKDVEANTIVGGVPAKFVRYITPDFIPPYFAGATFDASIPGV